MRGEDRHVIRLCHVEARHNKSDTAAQQQRRGACATWKHVCAARASSRLQRKSPIMRSVMMRRASDRVERQSKIMKSVIVRT